MRTFMALALVAACSSKAPRTGAHDVRAVGTADTTRPPPAGAHGSGRDRWRGGGVYLDGQPIGALRYAELPTGLTPVWETRTHRMPFKAGEPVQYRESRVPRYRIVDYLLALGVRLDDITEVHIHGSREAVIVLTRDDLKKHPDDLLFKFASDTGGKPVPVIRNIDAGTSFDDMVALAIYAKRTPPTLAADHTPLLDGRPVHGIPYHGEPLRQGVRVYVDNRLATVLKRNQLVASGATHWQLADVLAKQGVPTQKLARLELIHDDERLPSQPWRDAAFSFHEGGSGEIVVGAEPASSIALFTN